MPANQNILENKDRFHQNMPLKKHDQINVSINDCDAEVWHTPGSPAKFELM